MLTILELMAWFVILGIVNGCVASNLDRIPGPELVLTTERIAKPPEGWTMRLSEGPFPMEMTKKGTLRQVTLEDMG